MGVSLRFRMRWMLHSAAIFLAAAIVLLFSLRIMLNRSLGHDYAQGFRAINDLTSSLQIAVGVPLLVYVVLASVFAIAFKVFMSHKIAGPLYRLERCAAAFASGDFSFVTKLRHGDELNNLAQSVNALRAHGASQVETARSGVGRVRAVLDEMERLNEREFAQGADRHLARLEEELSAFDEKLRQSVLGETSASRCRETA